MISSDPQAAPAAPPPEEYYSARGVMQLMPEGLRCRLSLLRYMAAMGMVKAVPMGGTDKNPRWKFAREPVLRALESGMAAEARKRLRISGGALPERAKRRRRRKREPAPIHPSALRGSSRHRPGAAAHG
jgi:hypothetical protein